MKDQPLAQSITLRRSEPADENFLLRVYASTRAAELAMVPWSDEQKSEFIRIQFAAQQNHYQTYFPEQQQFVVLRDGELVGRYWVAHRSDEIKILDITILPRLRNAGIGTYLVSRILGEGEESRKPISVYVETFNPSLKFFEKLGFVATETQGMHVLMRWTPGQEANQNSTQA
jgi:N-acetylglutamate synthase-like GNAT family acetyltransferase